MSEHSQPSARELLAYNVRRLRAGCGWTQEDLAEKADMDRSFLAHVERQARNVSLDSIERIALAFAVPITELFRDIDTLMPPSRKRASRN